MSSRRAARTGPVPAGRPAPREHVRRDVDITRVLVVIVLVLGACVLAYLGVVWTQARQGLDVRHLIDVSLGPKEYGTLAGFGAGLVAFVAVLKRSNKTEKMVGYDVPHGVSEAIRVELAAHAQAAAAERDRHHRDAMEQARQHHGLVIVALNTIAERLGEIGQDGLDHTSALDGLVDLLQDSQVQVSFANPDRLKPLVDQQPAPAPVVEQVPEPDVLEPAPEPVGERGPQLVPADRVWGPEGPPRLRSGGRSSHRAATGTLPVVPPLPAPADIPRVERHAETLPPLPPLPTPRTVRPYDLTRLAARPSTAVQRAVAAAEAGQSFDDIILGGPPAHSR